MSISMELYNAAQDQQDRRDTNNPFFAFTRGITKDLEDKNTINQKLLYERKLMEQKAAQDLQQKKAKFDQFQRQTNLLNASQSTTEPKINTLIGRADRNIYNPTYAGTKVIKPSMKSLALSAYGGVSDSMDNGYEKPDIASFLGQGGTTFGEAPQVSPTQDLIQSAQQVAPQQTVENQYSMGLDENFNPKLVDNSKEIQTLKLKGAELGVDTSGMNRGQIIKSISEAVRTPIKTKAETVAEKKFEADQVENERIKKLQEDNVKQSAQRTISTIKELKNNIKYFGAMGDLPAFPAEYAKKNWAANFNTLKDKMVVDLMMQLKSASKNGSSGFGALSEKEGARLENAATPLQKGMSEEDALKYLNELEDSANNILNVDTSKKAENSSSGDPEYDRYLQLIGQ